MRWLKGYARPSYIWNFGRMKCESRCKMAGTNADDDMSSSARNTGSKLLRGEGDLAVWFLLTGGWSWQGGKEKPTVDANLARLRASTGLPEQEAKGIVYIAAFSSCKSISNPLSISSFLATLASQTQKIISNTLSILLSIS